MKILALLFSFLTFFSCTQKEIEMNTPDKAYEKFTQFLAKDKFLSENYYPGIVDESMRPDFTKKINQIALDFKIVSESEEPTDKKYQEKIRIGLARFSGIDIDTEDRERICEYIQELMDIIELESSNGQLNKFIYGVSF